MKSSTSCVLAIRNVGDANDKGEIHNGSLKEMILQIAQFVGGRDMKRRFQFCIARTEADARAGITIKGDPTNQDSSLMEDLDRILSGLPDDQTLLPGLETERPVLHFEPSGSETRIEGDTWTGAEG